MASGMRFFSKRVFSISLHLSRQGRDLTSVSRNFVRFYAAPKKRFYQGVSITKSNGLYEVNLDQRKLKTPLGKIFQVPNEALAISVATEWDAQDKVIDQSTMHLTALCNTVLDNPYQKKKEDIVQNSLEYLENDTLCFRSEEPHDLAQFQIQKWDPIVDWFEKRYDVSLNKNSGIIAVDISPETRARMETHLLSYGDWTLFGINYLTENLKSLILTQAMVDGKLSAEAAVSLSRLELEYQIGCWGNVEWAHDADLYQLQSRVSAGILFVQLNKEETHLQQKKIKKNV